MAAASDVQSVTVILGNLPQNTTSEEFEEFVSQYGPIKRSFLIKDEENKCKGVGYATFALKEDAEEVLNQTLKFNGHHIRAKLAPSRSKREPKQKKNTPLLRKERKAKLRLKRARLIIRNLSFTATEESLKKLLSKFGNVVEVTVPKYKDGKMRGYAFVGFDKVNSASKAIRGLNATKIEGRPIAVDFVVQREKYKEMIKKSENNNAEAQNEEEDGVVEEEDADANKKWIQMRKKKKEAADNHLQKRANKAGNEDKSVKKRKRKKKNSISEGDDESTSKISDTDEDSDSNVHKQPAKSKHKPNENDSLDDSELSDGSQPDPKDRRQKKRKAEDVAEGRTLFVRNLSFETTTEHLKEAMQHFGPVSYALLCIDPLNEHPKGTAFVKFDKKEDAEKCLQAASEESLEGVVLDGRRLTVSLAMSREDIERMYDEKRKKGKDNRNLYLAREGLIYAGSEAAQGVSESDLKKRLVLETRRRRLLKNLHYFISPTRLCIHNLPATVDDFKLRKLFKKAARDPNAKITEARVMREDKGHGKSKGFGFVNFVEHEHALEALRKLNNNPSTFTVQKRPIVEFSIENKKVLNMKQRRLERSRKKKEGMPSVATSKDQAKKDIKNQQSKKSDATEDESLPSFAGSTKREGVKGLSTHFGPKIRHKPRNQDDAEVQNGAPKSKRKNKKKAAKNEPKIDLRQTPKAMKKEKRKNRNKKPISRKFKNELKDEVKLQHLIKQYQHKTSTSSEGKKKKRSKWFAT